jgi:hypothetical protein
MDASWVTPLIAGLAGVLGAGVGGSALLKAGRDDRSDRRDTARRDAFVSLYAAAMGLGQMYSTWVDLQPKTTNTVGRKIGEYRLGLQIAGHRERLILERFLTGSDAMWEATGRARAAAQPNELPVVEAVENAFGDWDIPKPMPDSWVQAIKDLRRLLSAWPA